MKFRCKNLLHLNFYANTTFYDEINKITIQNQSLTIFSRKLASNCVCVYICVPRKYVVPMMVSLSFNVCERTMTKKKWRTNEYFCEIIFSVLLFIYIFFVVLMRWVITKCTLLYGMNQAMRITRCQKKSR